MTLAEQAVPEVTKAAPAKKTTAAKKKTTAKKKTAKKKTSSSIRLSAAEKKLVQNYRKCNMVEKKIIDLITEKAAEGIDANAVINLLKG